MPMERQVNADKVTTATQSTKKKQRVTFRITAMSSFPNLLILALFFFLKKTTRKWQGMWRRGNFQHQQQTAAGKKIYPFSMARNGNFQLNLPKQPLPKGNQSQQHVRHKKNLLLSMKSWLCNRDPLNILL